MISVGLDIGTQFVKIIVLNNHNIVATHINTMGTNAIEDVAYANYKTVMEKGNIAISSVDCVAVTGIGQENVNFANYQIPEVLCSARGVDWLRPGTDALLDLGTEKTMVVKIQEGRPIQIQRNDRCASGTGLFLTIAAKPLGKTPEELCDLAAKSTKNINISSNCTVFAESEIISLIHHKEKTEDIAWAIFKSMASKVFSLLIKAEPIGSLMIIGWLAKNNAMVKAIKLMTGYNIIIPSSLDPHLVTALGAALIGCEEHQKSLSSSERIQ